jgi:hypothetical protein
MAGFADDDEIVDGTVFSKGLEPYLDRPDAVTQLVHGAPGQQVAQQHRSVGVLECGAAATC